MRVFQRYRLERAQIPLRRQQFGVEDAASCCAANRVVRKRGELVAEQRAGAQSANRRRHTVPGVAVTAWLWAVVLMEILDGLFRRAW